MSGAEEGIRGVKIEVLKYMIALIPLNCWSSIAKSVITTPFLKLGSLRTSL
jgi:hypothetical protein